MKTDRTELNGQSDSSVRTQAQTTEYISIQPYREDNQCPACGPVLGTLTSRYCHPHVEQLKRRYRDYQLSHQVFDQTDSDIARLTAQL